MENRPEGIEESPRYLALISGLINGTYRLSPYLGGELCYQILTRPSRKPFTSEEQAFLDQAQQQFVRVGKFRIRTYHWRGSGPKVLLAHGWNSDTGRWWEFAPWLRSLDCNVLACDAPAHGQSKGGGFSIIAYAQAVQQLTQTFQPETIIGHSAGGMSAAYFLHQNNAAHLPQKLAFLGVPARLTDFLQTFQDVLQLRPGVMEALEQSFIRRWNVPFNDFDMQHLMDGVQGMDGLVIHCQDDEVAPVDGMIALAKRWEPAELMLTEGLGHDLFGEEVWEKLGDFIKK